MKVNKTLFIFCCWILFFAFIYWNYKIEYPSGTWRYRLTVNVETPEGLKSGSAVRQVHVDAKPPFAFTDVNPSKEVEGEAVVVDLGDRGKLFALIDIDDWQIITKTFPGHGGLTPEGIRYYNSLDDEIANLPWEAYPRIVAFKDINDPRTVFEPFTVIFGAPDQPIAIRNTAQRVEDNLATYFGNGVRLRDIVLEMTDDKVTWKPMHQVLPWLPAHYSKLLDGENDHYYKAKYPVANSLGSGSFSTKKIE